MPWNLPYVFVMASKKTILLFARDPGGANAIAPLVVPLRNRGFSVSLFGKDVALKTFDEAGLVAQDILRVISPITPESVMGLLHDNQPDFLFTGTSADDMAEKYLWQAARELGIPSFAILDQWINYGLRFSRHGVSELAAFHAHPILEFLPDKICVMDDFAKQEAIQEGLEADRIIVTGQPYFETVLKRAQSLIPSFRRIHAVSGNTLLLVFASEPITTTYHETESGPHFWGYTELSILRSVLTALSQLPDLDTLCLVIRPHPKEGRAHFDSLLNDISPSFRVLVDSTSPSLDLICSSDLVIGMSSMFLLEASLVGQRILSVQIGLHRPDPFVLSRMGVTKSVTLEHDLFEKLTHTLKKPPNISYTFIHNPVERVINEMVGYL
ncbi:hypothetical protein [Candidatus Magnetaquicoccus inordinatus]|uniref:hypothetical protein n=1 Tax=Candidatus Magnetaquicoccus inordinatus TaxID=2496818 RepID=UPI00102C9CF7|nr:hypothetical protein [Candidatus Magnetaquicoccus inordinatus]